MVGKQAKLAIGLVVLVVILGSGAYSAVRTAIQSARGQGTESTGGGGTTVVAAPAAPGGAGAGGPGVADGVADGARRGEEAPPPVQGPPAPIVINVGPQGPRPAPVADTQEVRPREQAQGRLPTSLAEFRHLDNLEVGEARILPDGQLGLLPPDRPQGRDDEGQRSAVEATRAERRPVRPNVVPVPTSHGLRQGGQTFTQTVTPGSVGHGGFVIRETPPPPGRLRPNETASQRSDRVATMVLGGQSGADATRGQHGTLGSGRDQTGGRGNPADTRGQEVLATGDLAQIRALAAERLARDLAATPNLTQGTGPVRPDGPSGSATTDRQTALEREAERARQIYDASLTRRF